MLRGRRRSRAQVRARPPGAGGLSGAAAAKLRGVEIFFTSLLVIVGLVTAWFAVYVVYRLYADQR